MQRMLSAEAAKRSRLLTAAPRQHSRDTSRFVRKHEDHAAGTLVANAPRASDLPELKVPVPPSGAKVGER